MITRIIRSIKRRISARLPKQIVQVSVNVPVLQSDLMKGRMSLITGGTSGLGFAMAEAFCRRRTLMALGQADKRIFPNTAAVV